MAQTICFALWVLLSVALCRGATEFWSIREGDICNVTVSFPRPSDKDVEFFECMKPTYDVTQWPWVEIGIWRRARCFIEDQVFDASYKTCRSKKSVRRQQSICAQQPASPYCQPACQGQQCNVQVQIQQPYVQPVIQPQLQQQCCQQQPIVQPVQPPCQPCVQQPCPQQPVCPQPILPTLPPQPQPCQQQCVQPVVPMPCPLAQGQGSQGAQVGGICSWMLAPLAADPSTTCGFLQCVPRQPGQYCGVWVKMPCAPATRFDVNVQVCVWDEMRQCGGMVQQQCCPTPIAPTQAPCTPCPVVQPCVQQPCQPQILPTMPIIQPTCTTGTLPIAPCNQQQQCPGFSSCQTQSNVCCQPVFGG